MELVLNSHPLMATLNDPNDISALSPEYFLIGQLTMALSEHDIQKLLVKYWELVNQAQHSFWTRLSCEYLHTLQYC